MEKKTLKELFESRKDELVQKITGLSLPKDAVKIQTAVSNYMNELFDSDGEFRQNLTQSEDYILQAALSLLNVQQSMIGEFASAEVSKSPRMTDNKESPKAETASAGGQSLKKDQFPYAIGGSAVGGAAGALIFGTWGAVFGAIAGTALVLYSTSQLSRQDNNSKMQQPSAAKSAKKPVEEKINVNVFIGIVANICESIDDLLETTRTQMQRLRNSYENQEKPTFLGTYSELASNLQQLFNLVDDPDSNADDVKMQIGLVKRSLKNYGIVHENGKLINK